MSNNFGRILDEEYRKMRDAGVSHQEAMERLRIASAKAAKMAAAKIVADLDAEDRSEDEGNSEAQSRTGGE